MSDCPLCGEHYGGRRCLLNNLDICRFCCKKIHDYDRCEGCSFRVWAPGCTERNLVDKNALNRSRLKSLIQGEIDSRAINNTEQLLSKIKQLGLSVHRHGKDYMGIRVPGENKSFRIKFQFEEMNGPRIHASETISSESKENIEDFFSTSVLAQKAGINNKDLFSILEKKGLIYRNRYKKWRLTELGTKAGGKYKKAPNGKAEYPVWPAHILDTQNNQDVQDRAVEKKEPNNNGISNLNIDSISNYLQEIHWSYKNETISAKNSLDSNKLLETESLNFTDEQNLILGQPLKFGEVMKVVAFAGTGKTTTICEYAKKYREIQFLYLAYNKSVQVEATKKFPFNVTCRTAHSIAYQQLGYKFQNKLVGNVKAFHITRLFELDSYLYGTIIIKILNNYMNSIDKNIRLNHFPKEYFGNIIVSDRKRLIDLAENYWEMMIDENNIKAPMLHDGYLKLFHLQEPKLYFDCILVDEAQDLNPVIFDIIKEQKCAKIYIGDSHQQIYAFRGAIDVMDIIEPDYLFYLTNSFRFNPWIGRITSSLLNIFKQETKQITGLNKSHSETSKQTIITRTNAVAFIEAVKFINKASLGFVGGSAKYRFGDILNVYWLYDYQFEKIKDPFYKNFMTFEDFRQYVTESQEVESRAVLAIVEELNHEIPAYLNAIYKAEVHEANADVVFSTAHKSKGLEWGRVVLSHDFYSLCRLKMDAKSHNESPEAFVNRMKLNLPGHADEYFKFNLPWPYEINELNLIYVAATRAKNELKLNTDLNIFCELVEKNDNLIM